MTGGVDTGFPHDRKKDFEQLRLRRKLAVYFHTDAGNLCITDKLRHIVPGIDVFLAQYLNGTAKLPDSGGVFFGSGVLPQNLPYGGNSHNHLIVQPRFQVQDFLLVLNCAGFSVTGVSVSGFTVYGFSVHGDSEHGFSLASHKSHTPLCPSDRCFHAAGSFPNTQDAPTLSEL
jgi:hypothetical protein